MIPHLATDHGEDEEDGQHAPRVLVQQELKVVPPEFRINQRYLIILNNFKSLISALRSLKLEPFI